MKAKYNKSDADGAREGKTDADSVREQARITFCKHVRIYVCMKMIRKTLQPKLNDLAISPEYFCCDSYIDAVHV